MPDTSTYVVHCDNEPGGSCRITNFGATGDLTKRKLLPALYDLWAQDMLPTEFAIVGFGRRAKDEAELRSEFEAGVREFARLPFDEAKWKDLAGRIYYQQGAYDQAASFQALDARLREVDEKA